LISEKIDPELAVLVPIIEKFGRFEQPLAHKSLEMCSKAFARRIIIGENRSQSMHNVVLKSASVKMYFLQCTAY
jgi:hypothetical protein